MGREPLLRIESLTIEGHGESIVGDSGLELIAGDRLFVIGPNGAGKSTMLAALLGTTAARGRVLLGGEDLMSMTTPQRIRAGVALCPQNRRLFADMSVRENLLIGAQLRRDGRGVREDLDMLRERVDWLGERWGQLAGSLSGGEQQLVAIGRALMSRPRLLLLDEPTIGLSHAAVQDVIHWLRDLTTDRDVSVLGAEQNLPFVQRCAHRVANMRNGRITDIALIEELYARSADNQWIVERLFGILDRRSGDKS